jgi:3-isopropylmalate dehydrogenase
MKTYRIALMPGDGIGPEVVDEAVRVLDAVAARCAGIGFSYETLPVGAGEYLRSGDPLPASSFERSKEFDAILLGAMGMPGVRWPTGVEMTPQIDLREKLDLYCGLRPLYLFDGADSPLANRKAGDIDMMLVRESTEGLFSSRLDPPSPDPSCAQDRMLITRHGSERLFRSAFEQAKGRRGHVTLVDKANVLPSMAFFRRIFDEIAREYPDIATDRVYVDAASLFFVRRPESFDVVVTENMFGDILSDLGAALVGGMGMAPSADIGPKYGVFQPSHGSAPDIAGRGIANPVATILSAAMMLEWFGGEAALAAAKAIHTATRTVLADRSARTPDVGGKMSTVELGRLIADAVPAVN